MTALIVLREKVIRPLLAASAPAPAASPNRSIQRPSTSTTKPFASSMRDLFTVLGVAA